MEIYRVVYLEDKTFLIGFFAIEAFCTFLRSRSSFAWLQPR